MFFGGFYNQNIVVETVSEYNDVQKLMEWYKLILIDQLQLEDLEAINTIDDVDALKDKCKKNGLAHIELFKEQANIMKKMPQVPQQ